MTFVKDTPQSSSAWSESSSDGWVERNLNASQHSCDPVLLEWQAHDNAPDHRELVEDLYDSEADISNEEWIAENFKGENFNQLCCSGCLMTVAYNCTVTQHIRQRTAYIVTQAPYCSIRPDSFPQLPATKRFKKPSLPVNDTEMASTQTGSQDKTQTPPPTDHSETVFCLHCGSSIGFYDRNKERYLLFDVLLSLFG